MTLILSFVLSAFFAFLFVNSPPPPFSITTDMAPGDNFQKRLTLQQKDPAGFVYYADDAKTMLANIDDKDLLAFRCADSFVRTVQGAYILENIKTKTYEKKRITNLDFLEYMRSKEPSLPKGKRILSGRVCELQDKTVILTYSVGTYETQGADSQNPRQVILNSNDNEVFIEFMPKGSLAGKYETRLAESDQHMRCEKVFQISTNRIIYFLCEEKGDFNSAYYVATFDTNSKAFKILKTCENNFDNTVANSCY